LTSGQNFTEIVNPSLGRVKHKRGSRIYRFWTHQTLYLNKMLSYRRETALQGALQTSPKVEDWNWETIFYGHYRSIFNHSDIIGRSLSNSAKKRKIMAITAFKVIQSHRDRYQSKVRMRFPISD